MGGVFKSVGQAVGSVGGLTNGIAQGFTPQNEFQANSPLNVGGLNQQISQAQGNLGTVNTNQNALAQALLAQSQGQGPNPAQDMLNQATNQNIKQNTGMIASQKGINPALAVRLASQNAAEANQQAAGQGALMGAQQQLAAQQNLQNLYGQQAQQNLQNISTSGQLANQASLGTQGINAGTSAQNAAATQNTASGLLNSIGGAASMGGGGGKAHGGFVEKFADGGSVVAQPFASGNFGKSNASADIAKQMMQSAGINFYPTGMTPVSFGPGAAASAPAQLVAGGPMDATGIAQAAPVMMASKGGKIPEHLHPVAQIYHPDFMQAKGTTQLKSEGGKVPGKAKVKGDSPKNDTVETMLSPGELVIPRSVMGSKDPVQGAADFVASKLKERESKNPQGDFKEALKKAISSRKGA